MNLFKRNTKPIAETVSHDNGELGTIGSARRLSKHEIPKRIFQGEDENVNLTDSAAPNQLNTLYNDMARQASSFIAEMREVHKLDVVNNIYESNSSQLEKAKQLSQEEKDAVCDVIDSLSVPEGTELLCALLNVPCSDKIGALHCIFTLLLEKQGKI